MDDAYCGDDGDDNAGNDLHHDHDENLDNALLEFALLRLLGLLSWRVPNGSTPPWFKT